MILSILLVKRIEWSWVQIPLKSTFYSYFKESFCVEYHMYILFRYTHVITSSIFQLKKRGDWWNH